MLIELANILSALVLGLMALRFARYDWSLANVALSVPLGTVLIGLLAMLGSILGVLYIALPILVWLATFQFVVRHRDDFFKRDILVVAVLAALIVLAFNRNVFTIVSYDSLKLLMLSKVLSFDSGIAANVYPEFASWGVLLPVLHAYHALLGDAYFVALQPALMICGYLAIGALLAQRLVGLVSNARASILAVLLIGTLFTSYFVVFNIVYVHNSTLSGVLIALTVMGLCNLSRERNWIVLTVLLVGFMLLRIEGPIMVLPLLVATYHYYPEERHTVKKIVVSVTVVAVVWYSFLGLVNASSSSILTPDRVAVIVGPLIGFAGYVHLVDRVPLLQPTEDRIAHIMLAVLAFAFFVAALISDELITSVMSVFRNFYETGGWGYLWTGLGLLFASCAVLFSSHLRWQRVILTFVIAFLLIAFLLSLGRIPYRIGWGDSANRMMMHILPLVACYIAGTIATLSASRATLRRYAYPSTLLVLFCLLAAGHLVILP